MWTCEWVRVSSYYLASKEVIDLVCKYVSEKIRLVGHI